LKIAYVIDYFAGVNGGTERQLFTLIEGMSARGHDVALYVLRDTEFTKNLSDFVCPVFCMHVQNARAIKNISAWWRLRRSLVGQGVDVVHGFFNDTAMMLPPLMVNTGIKCFTSRRDMGIWYSSKKLVFLRLVRFCKNRVICNSQAVADFTKHMERKPEKDILVIYNGIDPVAGAINSENYNWMADHFFSDDVINVILLANIRPVKRVEDLILAAARLKNTGLNIQYYLVGRLANMDYVERLRELISIHQLQDSFHFTGQLAAPRGCLGLFDVGVLTSASEGFSNTIMEYLDAGLPVIASNVGGNPELIIDGYNGLLYEASSVDVLAKHIYRVATDKAFRGLLGKNGKKFISRFSVSSMIDRYEKAYKGAWEEAKEISPAL